MKADAKALLEKARGRLDVAAQLIESGAFDDAVSRAYYAAFHAASAALIAEGKEAKTHAGTHNMFYKTFVSTGRFPNELNKVFADLYMQRQHGDYDPEPAVFNQAETVGLVEGARRFVEQIAKLLA